MPLDSPYIYVSGIAESELLFNDTDAVNVNLGLQDSFGQVWIQDINASFGFNSTPHSVELTIVAKDQIPVSQDRIGETCALKIGSMRFYGYVTHVDSSISSAGFVTRVSCQDGRQIDLNKYLIHTEPLLDSNLSNVIVVPKELETGGTLYSVNSPLWLMTNYGATYSEIYNAVINRGIVKLPSPSVIANRLGNHEAYRWPFSLTPLFDALLQIFDDCGYDVYYYNDEIRLIDRSQSVEVAQAFLDDKYKINTRDGYDQSDRPTSYTILGAKKQGGVGTISNVVEYQNLVSVGTDELIPCWNDIEIMYHDNNGVLRRYKPTDDELKMAIKGIEHWVYYKRYEFEQSGDDFPRGWMESRIDPYPYGIEGSAVEAALSFGGGRTDVRKVIKNRRSLDCNWLVQWYDAVSRHARTYYGKLYYCSPSQDFLRKCMIIDSAWVDDNVDNRDIPDVYSPFYQHGKISAFVEFSKDDVRGFGLDGTSTPVAYTEWNESADKIYLPISVSLHSPTEDKDRVFPGITDTRIYVTLPEIVVYDVEDHPLLVNLPTLQSFEQTGAINSGSGVIQDTFQLYLTERDYNDPKMTIVPMSGISNFFIPVQYNIRYGDDGSATSGTTDGFYNGEIDDKFAPWTRQNPQNPTEEMLEKTLALVGNDDIDHFFEAEVTGLPEINFFANFSNDDHIPVYPFTSISITIGSNGMTSRYNSKTQLNELLRANKIEWSRFRSRLDRIQHFANLSRMNTDMEVNLEPQRILTSHWRAAEERQNVPKMVWGTTSTNPEEYDEEEEVESKSFVKAVRITGKRYATVADPNGGATAGTQEFYQGEDDEGNVWPPNWATVDDQLSQSATNQDPYANGSTGEAQSETRVIYQDGQWIEVVVGNPDAPGTARSESRKTGFAPCNDGYLRKGQVALYHQEDINGTIYSYFTGGLPLEDARMVEIVGDIVEDGDNVYANVKTLPHPSDTDTDTYQFFKVPFASAREAISQGYGDGSVVPISHNKMVKSVSANSSSDATEAGGEFDDKDPGSLRPGTTHSSSDGSPLGTLYIVNPPVVGALTVTVITPPGSDGSGGTVAVVGRPDIQYGAGTEQQDTIYFVGADPDLIYEGDYGVMTRGMDDDWYVTILKPLFTPYDSFE